MIARRIWWWVACLGAGVAMHACDPVPQAERCTNIPPGGCPKSKASTCNDPSCEAIYLCNPDNTWTLAFTCGARDAAADAPAARDAAPAIRDADVDAPPGAYGGPGCAALEAPDCTLGTVLDCPANSCCGCEDLFVCEGGNWHWWGYCQGGAILQSDR